MPDDYLAPQPTALCLKAPVADYADQRNFLIYQYFIIAARPACKIIGWFACRHPGAGPLIKCHVTVIRCYKSVTNGGEHGIVPVFARDSKPDCMRGMT
jgi:hypothetical protein